MSQELAQSSQSLTTQFDRKGIFRISGVESRFQGVEGTFDKGKIYRHAVYNGSYEAWVYNEGIRSARIPHGGPPSPGSASPKKSRDTDLRAKNDLKHAVPGTYILNLTVRDTYGTTILEFSNGKWTGNPEALELKEIVRLLCEKYRDPRPKAVPSIPQLHAEGFA